MATAVPEFPSLARDRAFEALYQRYVKDVYRYALALLRNPADAEDVTQTTFMNAYQAFKRGEEIEKPQNWLIKIAHNAARTRYARATRRVKEVPLEDHVERLAIPEDDKPDVREVLDALGRLPLNQRAALVMRELEGRTYAEIADTLGVSVPAVETLIFRARRSLRLRASAVRVLTAVQLPTSLTELWNGGGGAVAGGGAAIGAGFLVKAAVALVAGAVATGLGGSGGGRSSGAVAAPALRPAAMPTAGSGHSLRVGLRALASSSRRAAQTARVPGLRAGSRAKPDAKRLVDTPQSASATAKSSTGGSGATSSAGSSTAVSTSTTQAASGTLGSATSSAASTVSSAAPPVTVPQLPSAPVSLPPPPPPPSLPSLP